MGAWRFWFFPTDEGGEDGKERRRWEEKEELESEGGTGERRRNWEAEAELGSGGETGKGGTTGKTNYHLEEKKNYAEEEYHTGAVAG